MDEIKTLWAKRYESRGRLNMIVFSSNMFLIMTHIFFIIIYTIIGHTVMNCISIALLFCYFFFFTRCYKNINRYMHIVFFLILIHLFGGVLSFGWKPCYQNWCFGMLSAYFLPAFSKHRQTLKKRSLSYPFIIVCFYFLLSSIYPLVQLKISMQLNTTMTRIIFIANNTIVFIAISMFTWFYTSTNERRVRKLTRKADYDELTNLYNRHALNVMWNRISTSSKENKKPYSIAIIDIDHFKKINDKYGHSSGDVVLKNMANIIKSYSMQGIVPGRWGGEEFIMMAPSDMEYEEFTKALDHMRRKISETKFIIENNKRVNITVSIGSAPIEEYGDIEAAVAVADANLYTAKETGRNKLVK